MNLEDYQGQSILGLQIRAWSNGSLQLASMHVVDVSISFIFSLFINLMHGHI